MGSSGWACSDILSLLHVFMKNFFMTFFLDSTLFFFPCPLVQTKFPSRVIHTPVQRGLDRWAMTTKCRLTICFQPRPNVIPQLAGVAVTPVVKGRCRVGLEPLAQSIHSGAMQRDSVRPQKGLNRAAAFKCARTCCFAICCSSEVMICLPA